MDARVGRIAEKIQISGGRVFLVGGAVRDNIRGVKPKDFDFVVCGITEQSAKDIISAEFKEECVNVISNAPVFSCGGHEWAMARIEEQKARGKSGFTFISSPSVTIKDDLRRRDFTVNAIAVDIVNGNEIDPFGGKKDIKHRVLRCVDKDTFVQSPERVFRGISQAARFGFDIHHDTIELMVKMQRDFDTIPVEQIWLHFEKAGSQLNKNSWKFVWFLFATGWNRFFPEVKQGAAEDALKENSGKTDDKVEWFIASLCAKMTPNERNSFFDRINAPKRVRRVASEFCTFGSHKPARLIEGRDIEHIVPKGKEMGQAVNMAFIAQINGQVKTKEEAIDFVKNNFGEK